MEIKTKNELGGIMKVGILGTGAYGLALALSFLENTSDITMWTKLENEYEELTTNRENKRVLPGVTIPNEIHFTLNMEEAMVGKDIVVIAIPTEYIDSILKEFKTYYHQQIILIASKGISEDGLFIRDKIKEFVKQDQIAVISGPSFAIDLSSHVPVGLSLASHSYHTMDVVESVLAGKRLKLRKTEDVLGVEICGAIKNVIAIASGMLDGMGYPISTKAMLITESLHDIKSMIHSLGGDKKTILSFAGFGDLLLTCTSEKSRNYSFGRMVGIGNQEEIKEYMDSHTIEGLTTIYGMNQVMQQNQIEMPVVSLISDIIHCRKEPDALLDFLIEKE